MDEEGFESQRTKSYTLGDDLAALSVDELNKIKADLQEEIERIASEIAKKGDVKANAESIFSR